MAFYNTTLSQSLDDRYYKYSEIREIYRNQTNQILALGINTIGQLGDNTRVDKGFNTPGVIAGNWIKVSAGWQPFVVDGEHCGAIRSDGGLWVWGRNITGMLGLNDRVHRSSPVQVGTDKWVALSFLTSKSFAIRSDGALFAWGSCSGSGDLGLGFATGQRSSPVQIGTSSWIAISSGQDHTAAIRSDGALFTWGDNTYGELGQGHQVNFSSPVQVGTSSWIFVEAGYNRTFAIRSDYTLWAWGADRPGSSGGSLGHDNFPSNQSSPVQVTALDGTVSFVQVSSKYDHTLGLSTTGKVYGWGYNGDGTLATAPTVQMRPLLIVSDGTYIQVAAGVSGSSILRADGNAYWFGRAPLLSDGYRSSPVQIGVLKYRALSHSNTHLMIRE